MVPRAALLMVTVLATMLVLVPSPAFAYLDPGTGSVLLQGLLATIAAVGATLGYYWRSFTNYFSPKNKDYRHSAKTPTNEKK